MAENTIIKGCSCKNTFQDGEYGANKRLHNLMGKTGSKARCTVCSNVKDLYGVGKKKGDDK